jgi:7-carboxy-7-deazaguanine synthase
MGDTKLQSHSNTLRVSEIFYSLQGEGGRAGEASIFIRLQGCSAKHACFASGVICDTEFESGVEYTLEQLYEKLIHIKSSHIIPGWIVWTGGEPLDQLNPEILKWFKDKGYKQAIETSGIKPLTQEMANLLDYIVVSPKVAEHVLAKNFKDVYCTRENKLYTIDELRYVRHSGQPGVPQPSLAARYFYLSPHSDGQEINQENLKHCIKLCLENPRWRLSVQQHKLWRVL